MLRVAFKLTRTWGGRLGNAVYGYEMLHTNRSPYIQDGPRKSSQGP